MKTTNKILSLILAVLMVISIIPITASAEIPTSGTCGENLTWYFDKSTGTLIISGVGDMYDYDVDFGGFTISPFTDFSETVKHIVIGNDVTSVGDFAFDDFKNLETISLGSSITRIGSYAFNYCQSLTNITLPDGLKEIDSFAFRNCTSLTNVTLPDSLEIIGRYAFGGCESFSSVTIPINVQSIDNGAFYSCSNLKDVYYEGTKEQMGEILPWFSFDPVFSDAKRHYNSTGADTHPYNPVVTPPTCTEKGYTTYICACGYSNGVDNYVDAKGHSYVAEITIPATHLEEGLMTFTCTCGDTYTEAIAKLENHNYETVVTAPTCTERGYTTYTCECDDTYIDDYVDATGHNHTSEITTPATHTATGVKTFTCSCGDTYTETIEKLEKHNYDAVITAPTCTEQGYTTYTCECGDSYVDDYVNATGHADNDGDGYCDMDNELLDPSVECDHSCHKDGISGFIWKIINFFNKLFGLNKECACGVAHY